MYLHPILAEMRHNKVGAILISVQMAITLGILSNALFIIQQRIILIARPSGVDESNVFAVGNQWVGQPNDTPALVKTDLAELRALTGVVSAYVTNSYPLANSGWTWGISLRPDQQNATAPTAVYFADEHTLKTLALKLIAGRNFAADEIVDRGMNDMPRASGIIITRALAEKLFPGGNSLGQSVFLQPGLGSTRIIGIVDKLQVPWVIAGITFNDNSTLAPFRFTAAESYYLVRAQAGQVTAVMAAVQKRLFDINRARIIDQVQTLAEARAEAYRDDRALAVMLAVVSLVLLAVTAFGIVGLTSYWVTLRRRQIGIRRALGATRLAIVRYFQTENLLIASAGGVVGIAVAIALNLWMVSRFEMARLNYTYTIAGAVIVIALGQLAALWPALRAGAIPPAIAARTV